jgi:hypothetical protein
VKTTKNRLNVKEIIGLVMCLAHALSGNSFTKVGLSLDKLVQAPVVNECEWVSDYVPVGCNRPAYEQPGEDICLSGDQLKEYYRKVDSLTK